MDQVASQPWVDADEGSDNLTGVMFLFDRFKHCGFQNSGSSLGFRGEGDVYER